MLTSAPATGSPVAEAMTVPVTAGAGAITSSHAGTSGIAERKRMARQLPARRVERYCRRMIRLGLCTELVLFVLGSSDVLTASPD